MNSKFNTFILFLVLINTGVSFYAIKSINKFNNSSAGSNFVVSDNISNSANSSDAKKIPPEVTLLKQKNEELKKAKPYLFMGSEELSKYDCKTIKDSNEKMQCFDIQENFNVSLLFKDIKPDQIKNFDCTKIQDKSLTKKCSEYLKNTIEMDKIIK